MLCRLTETTAEEFARSASAALTERGKSFEITTAYGAIVLPHDAHETRAALALADERLYTQKRARHSPHAPDELRNVLMQVMAESRPDLPDHVDGVALLARSVGRRMGLVGEDLEILARGAELHDIGKVAVPDAILQKPGALDAGEREIVERHCEVGERILAAAPAMSPVARLVRSSHEHWDGRGYPDGRRGREIPLGARVIAVCDAFHAMTSERPYGHGTDASAAVAELRRCAGRQFDAEVVEIFCALLAEGPGDAIESEAAAQSRAAQDAGASRGNRDSAHAQPREPRFRERV